MKQEFLYSSQKSYITTLLSLVNCDQQGELRAKEILDVYPQFKETPKPISKTKEVK